jgi:hypothetical protein
MAVTTLVRNSVPADDQTTDLLPQGMGLAGKTRALVEGSNLSAENSA